MYAVWAVDHNYGELLSARQNYQTPQDALRHLAELTLVCFPDEIHLQAAEDGKIYHGLDACMMRLAADMGFRADTVAVE